MSAGRQVIIWEEITKGVLGCGRRICLAATQQVGIAIAGGCCFPDTPSAS